ncbi:DUF6292 family protein [Dactylosporangium sp. CS-033363]|uniref:DUF6292 family protein n=1 Tax=Dactylosporangium sp. CS-033363 TaxID=3239935 RepID=UPI003D8D2E9C
MVKHNAREKLDARIVAGQTGRPYTEVLREMRAARAAAGDAVQEPPRRAIATMTWSRHGREWVFELPDDDEFPRRNPPRRRDVTQAQDWPAFQRLVADEVGYWGWTVDRMWPDRPAGPGEQMDEVFTAWLTRDERGRNEDAAAALHQAAGVRFHTAPRLYARAVAAAITSAGWTVCNVREDGDEPRGLQVQLGDDTEQDGVYVVVMWREDRGWYWAAYEGPGRVIDGAHDLDGLCLMALPHDVAAAVLREFPRTDGAAAPAVWEPPAGYDENPPLTDYTGRWTSLPLERALCAYATPAG